jgi:hypothetical protein
MSVLLLVPGLLSFFLVVRRRVEMAFLYVYLPCLLCLPEDYQLRLPHLPPTSAAEFALFPLGMFGLFRLIRSGSFALMDILVLFFTASIGLSEILHAQVQNDGIFSAVTNFNSIFLAYVVGRTLIEPNLRLATVRAFVILLLLDWLPGLYEWRMGMSPYGVFGQKVLGVGIRENVQIRNGHGRMGAVFSNSEDEGIVFGMAFCLDAWLVYLRRVRASADLVGRKLTNFQRWIRTQFALSPKHYFCGFLFILCVLLTQARGPLIALAAAYLILQIPRFKHTRVMTILVAVLLLGSYKASTAYFESFKDINDPSAITEQEQSALYRLEMNRVYPAIAEKGGWTGWGLLEIPQVEGFNSLDNHYLLVHLAWGRLGYILFILIVGENIRVLLVRTWQFEDLEDRAFLFSMLGAMAVLWFTLLTVYLLIGWIQSTKQPHEVSTFGFSFRRVLT